MEGSVELNAGTGMLPAGSVLAAARQLLDRVDPDRSALTPAVRLDWATAARELADRATAPAQVLVGEADRTQSSMRATGTPTSTWLSTQAGLSRRESAGLLHSARALTDQPAVGSAALSGTIGAGQARAISNVLGSLADQLDDGQREQAQHVMLQLAAQLDADGLARSAGQVMAAVAPDVANEVLERRLQREAEAAQRNRSLIFHPVSAGSVTFRGSLPRIEAEEWMVRLDALLESQRRTLLERRDPLATTTSPEQRRADALIAMIRADGQAEPGPGGAGGRARLIVTVNLDALRTGAAGAGVISDGQQLSAGELRRLCCDAHVLPAVLGGASEILDVGRARRLVTPALRTVLILRDGGCAFPGCNARHSVCDAHHIVPWWAGGATALGNLVLLCHHHHALIEPAKYCTRDQWTIRLGHDGLPEVIPPRRIDAKGPPRRHQRLADAVRGGATAPNPAGVDESSGSSEHSDGGRRASGSTVSRASPSPAA